MGVIAGSGENPDPLCSVSACLRRRIDGIGARIRGVLKSCAAVLALVFLAAARLTFGAGVELVFGAVAADAAHCIHALLVGDKAAIGSTATTDAAIDGTPAVLVGMGRRRRCQRGCNRRQHDGSRTYPSHRKTSCMLVPVDNPAAFELVRGGSKKVQAQLCAGYQV